MRFWLRELAGWLLVALGLCIFYMAYIMLMNKMAWEAGQWSIVGFIVFRGGIHLLKVALAARVCMQAVTRSQETRKDRLASTSGHSAPLRRPAMPSIRAR